MRERPPAAARPRLAAPEPRREQAAVAEVDAFRDTNRLSARDKRALMGGTLERVYKWSPTGA